jgi:glycosyltransferase involved in cell wall biosynthesis
MKQSLLYLTSEDWAFLTHRLPMALAAQKAGFEVHVAARCGARAGEIESYGFTLHPLDFNRGSLSPLAFLREIRQVRALFKAVNPDIVHCIAVKPIIVGGIAGLFAPSRAFIHALTGLGSALMAQNLMSKILFLLLGFVLKQKKATALFQNKDDLAFLAHAFKLKNTALIRGSGIDTTYFAQLPPPRGEVRIALVARMLKSKGVLDAVEASRLLTQQNIKHQLWLVGTIDPYNPESLSQAEYEALASETITLKGHISDVREIWKDCAIALLPQQDREGLPKALLEAASCGRAIVTTDVPGCREIVRAAENGTLVPPKDPLALANALAVLIQDEDMRTSFGAASRALVQSDLSAEAVGEAIVALYHAQGV